MPMDGGTYTVGEVARLANVSVRTLHHHDEMGVLKPSGRSEAGYRLYTSEDLARLQQILFYRELGFALEAIRDLLSDPALDRREALRGQRDLVAGQVLRLEAVLGAIGKTLRSLEEGTPMTKEEMFEVFGGFDPSECEEEVRERWGDTEAYKESARRTKRYTKEDWERFMAESEEVGAAIATLFDEGVAPHEPRAMDAVERHRLLIDRRFYPCSHEMHAELGRLYVADPRFTATYERIRPGMAQYVSSAIAANAARARS